MKMHVVGVGNRNRGEKSKKSGKPYDGQSVYCIAVKAMNEGQGHKVVDLYFDYTRGVQYPDEVYVGDVINVDYNEDGYVEEVELVTRTDADGKPAKDKK